ncbi:MAG: hypothetical protein JF607_27480 [Burkholderiales bacterium]|nr:hypothetical protein [Burkholderiales bacterium]
MRLVPQGWIKAAELTSAVGAAVLGAGAALLLPIEWRAHAPVLLLAGAAVHGAGMTLKYCLEARSGAPAWWAQGLFVLCWAGLALLASRLWIAAAAGR